MAALPPPLPPLSTRLHSPFSLPSAVPSHGGMRLTLPHLEMSLFILNYVSLLDNLKYKITNTQNQTLTGQGSPVTPDG